MHSSLKSYYKAGKLVAIARNKGDQTQDLFHRNWYRISLCEESSPDKRRAKQAYDDGYAEHRKLATSSV